MHAREAVSEDEDEDSGVPPSKARVLVCLSSDDESSCNEEENDAPGGAHCGVPPRKAVVLVQLSSEDEGGVEEEKHTASEGEEEPGVGHDAPGGAHCGVPPSKAAVLVYLSSDEGSSCNEEENDAPGGAHCGVPPRKAAVLCHLSSDDECARSSGSAGDDEYCGDDSGGDESDGDGCSTPIRRPDMLTEAFANGSVKRNGEQILWHGISVVDVRAVVVPVECSWARKHSFLRVSRDRRGADMGNALRACGGEPGRGPLSFYDGVLVQFPVGKRIPSDVRCDYTVDVSGSSDDDCDCAFALDACMVPRTLHDCVGAAHLAQSTLGDSAHTDACARFVQGGYGWDTQVLLQRTNRRTRLVPPYYLDVDYHWFFGQCKRKQCRQCHNNN